MPKGRYPTPATPDRAEARAGRALQGPAQHSPREGTTEEELRACCTPGHRGLLAKASPPPWSTQASDPGSACSARPTCFEWSLPLEEGDCPMRAAQGG